MFFLLHTNLYALADLWRRKRDRHFVAGVPQYPQGVPFLIRLRIPEALGVTLDHCMMQTQPPLPSQPRNRTVLSQSYDQLTIHRKQNARHAPGTGTRQPMTE